MTEYSPFTPGQPAPVDLFVGRDEEVRRLAEHVQAAAATGRFQVAFLSGERGIGKSSLASFVKFYAERNHEMVGAHVFLGGADSLQEMTRRSFDKLLKESTEKKWFDRVSDLFGKNVEKVGLFGLTVTFTASEKELDALTRGFAVAMRALTAKLRASKKEPKHGVVLILDDINGLASLPAFAHWLKSTIDEIAVSQDPTPLCLLLVGLEERRQSLIDLQPSLARVFHLFPIEPWSSEETKSFLRSTFERVGVAIDADALDFLAGYAGGLPVLAHEIGEATLNVTRGKHIRTRDAVHGALNAAEVVRGLLTREEANNFDNFLRRMTRLGVILRVEDGPPGTYRFATHLHHIYLAISGLSGA